MYDMAFNHILVFTFLSLKSFCICFELLSGAVTGVGIIVASTSFALKCKYFECCDNNWIRFHDQRLQEELKTKFFGQHLAAFAVPKVLGGFYRNKNPKKPLVMSFHGLTGSGKNFISSIIANATYEKGTASSYVHIYSGIKDFPHKDKVPEYKDKLQKDLTQYTRDCERSLFIFDEIEKMPPGVLDSLKPYIDYYEHVDGVDYRKNVFIFLSNAGSSSITNLALNFWAQGKEREDIRMKDVEPLINRGAFNEHGGFQYSELLRSALVDVFIPFLPLEKKHVRKCVEAELLKRNINFNSNLVNEIADELLYFPEGEELYSASGCKRLEQKIDYHVN